MRITTVLALSLVLIFGISAVSIDDRFLIKNAFADPGVITGLTENLELSGDVNDVLPTIMPLTGEYYAVGYSTNNEMEVKTIRISSTGDIIGGVIDTLTISTADQGNWAKVDDDTLAVFYRGPSNYGTIKTVSVDAVGDNLTVLNTAVWEKGAVNRIEIAQIDTDTFAIAFNGNGASTGNLTTADINAAGAITIGNDFLVFTGTDTTAGMAISEVVSNFVGILYQEGTNSDLDLVTVSVSDTGVIGNAVTDKLDKVLDTTVFPHGPPVMVDSNTAILTYKDGTGTGIKTVDIDGSGNIAAAVTETVVIDAAGQTSGYPFKVADNVYAVVYGGESTDLYVKTIGISDSGDIDATVIDTLEVDGTGATCLFPTIHELSTGNFAIAYSCSIDVSTISIVAVAASSASGGSSDSSAPSLGGVGGSGFNPVDSGFSYNNNPTDVTGWKNDYPLARTPTGQLNTMDLKIMENKGITNIYFVSVHFGVPKAGAQGEAIVTYYPNQKNPIKVYDPNNLLGEIDFTVNPVKCKASSTTESCFNFALDHSFNDAPIHEMVGITVADLTRNVAYAYFNHGVEVYGDSLNPPVTQVITNPYDKHTHQITLTQTDRAEDLWTDEKDNTWTRNIMGSWLKITQDDYTIPEDNIMGVNGYKRFHPHFDVYKSGQGLLAEQIWDSSAIQSTSPKAIETKSYGFLLGKDDPTLRINDIALQKDIQRQIQKAIEKLNAPNQSLVDYNIIVVHTIEPIIIPDEILFAKDYSAMNDRKLSEIENALNLNDKKFYENTLHN